MGPFYCPGDGKVYIDLGFFATLRDQLMGAPGDFAQAYVIAHEVGHHVQNLLGITGKVDAQRGRVSEVQMNALSVRVELQADCLAGVWAHHSQRKGKGWLEQGDVEEALNAAARSATTRCSARLSGARAARVLHPRQQRAARAWFAARLSSSGKRGTLQHLRRAPGALTRLNSCSGSRVRAPGARASSGHPAGR
jgi:hypothetical protein